MTDEMFSVISLGKIMHFNKHFKKDGTETSYEMSMKQR